MTDIDSYTWRTDGADALELLYCGRVVGSVQDVEGIWCVYPLWCSDTPRMMTKARAKRKLLALHDAHIFAQGVLP